MAIGALAGAAGLTLAAGAAGGIMAAAITGNCAKFGPISFGNCGTKAELNLSNESISQNIQESIQTSTTNVSESITSVFEQDVTLNNYNASVGCSNLKISQNINLNVYSSTNLRTELVSQMLTAVSNQIGSFIEQNQEQIKGALSDAADINLILNAKNRIVEVIQRKTTKESVINSLKNIITLQNQRVTINFADVPSEASKKVMNNPQVATPSGSPSTCVIDQNFLGAITTSTVISTVFNEINKDDRLNEIKAELEQKQSTQTTGIVDAIAGFFKSAVFMWMIVIIAVIVGIVLFWYFLLKNPEGIKALGDSASGVMSTARSGKSPSSTGSSSGSRV